MAHRPQSGGGGSQPNTSNTTTAHLQEQMANAMERVGEAAHNVGQRVTDFFQGDPFGTLVGRKIELATDATKLATENWGLNMEICDFINCTNDGPRDAVRAIKKRLQTQMGKNNAIVMYTLTVLETCVKNCDQRFAVLVTNREFVGELVKMISTKHDAPQIVQERVLSIIQSWADAFRDDPPLSGVVELYDEFRAKGVEFPATNIDAMAPIITPKQTVFPSVIDQQQRGDAKVATQTFPLPGEQPLAQPHAQQQQQFVNIGSVGPVEATPEQMAKLRSELDLVHVNLTVLRELVAQMKPTNEGTEAEAPDDFHFIRELYSTCKEMQKRILELIPSVTNEEVISVSFFSACAVSYSTCFFRRRRRHNPFRARTNNLLLFHAVQPPHTPSNDWLHGLLFLAVFSVIILLLAYFLPPDLLWRL